jgi:phosphoglycerol transferase
VPDGSESEQTRASHIRRSALDSVVVAAIALVILVLVYHLWDAHFGVPFSYLGPNQSPLVYAPDAPFYLMMVKGAIGHGWFLTNPSLGYPFGQSLHDIPHGLDNLNLLVLQVLGWIFGNPFVAVNVFFLLTFVGISVSAYLVLRRLGVSRLTGGALALLYTYLPYHFARGTAHLLLSAYWLVPVAGLLLVAVTSARPPFTRDAETDAVDTRDWKVSLRGKSSILYLLACAGLASTGSYYGAITLTLLVPVVIVDYLARRRTRVLASGAIAVAAILVVMVLNLTPTFVYWAQHGRNPDVVKRGPSETEVNGLKISQLLLPIEGHRVHALAEIQADSTRFSVLDAERGQQLGAIGAVGFVALLGAVLISARRRRPLDHVGDEPRPPPPLDTLDDEPEALAPPGDVIRVFGVATIVALVVGATSGISLIIAGIGISEIRSWNRVSIFIGFFALATVGFGIDWLRRRLPDRAWRTPVTVAALALLVLVGILDQVAPTVVPDYAAAQDRFDSDETFFTKVERDLPKGAAVFNLPYQFFPESGIVNGIGPYDQVRGYLHTNDLEWSWGGVVGSDADWAAAAAQQPPTEELLDRISAVGFSGIVLDRRGDVDGARDASLTDALGPPVFESPDGTLAFWDTREWARDARRRLGATGFAAKRAEALRDRGEAKRAG